jgi:hypothetical protein
VLLANRNEPQELVLKLGDFGTSFELEDDGKLPSTQYAGTKSYWAPVTQTQSMSAILRYDLTDCRKFTKKPSCLADESQGGRSRAIFGQLVR